jgi:hypothetical protein
LKSWHECFTIEVMTAKRIFFCLLLLITASGLRLNAQDSLHKAVAIDERYWSYDTNFIARVYLSQKYLNTAITKGNRPQLHYRPNSKLSVGVGATYGWFSLNLSAGLTYIKPKTDERGETKAFDLQGHFYGPRAVIDLFLGYYDGYHLDRDDGELAGGQYYSRPDIESWQAGFAAYYVLNWRKFSLRAAYLQAAWQHKSAGSVLLGYELFNSQIKGDSALVPSIYAHNDAAKNINQTWYFNMGPGVGYAYTLVIRKHWFASGAVTAGVAASWVRESSVYVPNQYSFSVMPHTSYKAALGYNATRFSVSATWADNTMYAKGELGTYAVSAGNARFHFAYRFIARKKFKEYWDFFQIPPL